MSISNADVGGTNAFTDDITLFSQNRRNGIYCEQETGIVTLSFCRQYDGPPDWIPDCVQARQTANLPAGATGYGQLMYCIRVKHANEGCAHTQTGASLDCMGLSSSGTGTSYGALSFWLPNRCV